MPTQSHSSPGAEGETYRTDVHELAGADVVGVDQEGAVVVIEKLANLIVVSLLDLENSSGRHLVCRWRGAKKKEKKKKTAVPSRSKSCKDRQQASVCLNRVPLKGATT